MEEGSARKRFREMGPREHAKMLENDIELLIEMSNLSLDSD